MVSKKYKRCDPVNIRRVQDENHNINVEEIMGKIDGYFGFVPKIFQVLSENPPALKAFFDKVEVMMVDETLPPLTKEFVSIGAAAALGSSHCLRTHLEVALKFGANQEQLLLAIILGTTITETTALSKSLRVYEEFCTRKDEDGDHV
ncbi:MAG TPA: carboxymuconolactone decarboxylase family protein [Methanobacterium subterraneum]|uniref:Carboxymuconolactone decarboxylase family protein n=1 Tax=Methanobacterium subterraneum TaxID=59277 RepID=A0A7J4TNL6_9EURY|nr:carboxymuconolactone decarboxylase family protein [Methanobacterium subterraneum]